MLKLYFKRKFLFLNLWKRGNISIGYIFKNTSPLRLLNTYKCKKYNIMFLLNILIIKSGIKKNLLVSVLGEKGWVISY